MSLDNAFGILLMASFSIGVFLLGMGIQYITVLIYKLFKNGNNKNNNREA